MSLEDNSFASDEDVVDLWEESHSEQEDGSMEWPSEMLWNLQDLHTFRRKRMLPQEKSTNMDKEPLLGEEGDNEEEG